MYRVGPTMRANWTMLLHATTCYYNSHHSKNVFWLSTNHVCKFNDAITSLPPPTAWCSISHACMLNDAVTPQSSDPNRMCWLLGLGEDRCGNLIGNPGTGKGTGRSHGVQYGWYNSAAQMTMVPNKTNFLRLTRVELSCACRPAGGPFRAQAERNDIYATYYVQHG